MADDFSRIFEALKTNYAVLRGVDKNPDHRFNGAEVAAYIIEQWKSNPQYGDSDLTKLGAHVKAAAKLQQEVNKPSTDARGKLITRIVVPAINTGTWEDLEPAYLELRLREYGAAGDIAATAKEIAAGIKSMNLLNRTIAQGVQKIHGIVEDGNREVRSLEQLQRAAEEAGKTAGTQISEINADQAAQRAELERQITAAAKGMPAAEIKKMVDAALGVRDEQSGAVVDQERRLVQENAAGSALSLTRAQTQEIAAMSAAMRQYNQHPPATPTLKDITDALPKPGAAPRR